MLKNIYTVLVLGLLTLIGCVPTDVRTPKFDVTTLKTTFKTGDSVLFNFSGNPDFITFYSGEPGKKYENVNRVTGKGKPTLQFTSLRAQGSQTGSLLIMLSKDFAGVGTDEASTTANIAKASWTDITNRAALSTGASTPSGPVDLSDFATEGKPVFLAFKYVGQSGSPQNKWTISGLAVSNTLPDGTAYTLANLTNTAITNYGVANTFSPGWVAYKVSNTFNWVISSGTSLVIAGASTAATATDKSEAWTLCGPIDLNKVSPDLGTFIKGMDTRKDNFVYKYLTAGTYTASFIATNSRLEDTRETVRQIQITVTK